MMPIRHVGTSNHLLLDVFLFSVHLCRHRFSFFFALTSFVQLRLTCALFSLSFRMRGMREMRTAATSAKHEKGVYIKTLWHSTEHFDEELGRARSNRKGNNRETRTIFSVARK